MIAQIVRFQHISYFQFNAVAVSIAIEIESTFGESSYSG